MTVPVHNETITSDDTQHAQSDPETGTYYLALSYEDYDCVRTSITGGFKSSSEAYAFLTEFARKELGEAESDEPEIEVVLRFFEKEADGDWIVTDNFTPTSSQAAVTAAKMHYVAFRFSNDYSSFSLGYSSIAGGFKTYDEAFAFLADVAREELGDAGSDEPDNDVVDRFFDEDSNWFITDNFSVRDDEDSKTIAPAVCTMDLKSAIRCAKSLIDNFPPVRDDEDPAVHAIALNNLIRVTNEMIDDCRKNLLSAQTASGV